MDDMSELKPSRSIYEQMGELRGWDIAKRFETDIYV